MKFLLDPLWLPIVFPALAGLAVWLVPKGLDRARAMFAAACAGVETLLVWPVFARVLAFPKKEALVFDAVAWLPLRVDHLASFILLATAVFGFLIALYSLGYMAGKPRQREYYAYLLWTVGLSCGALMANDLLLLLVCWGLLGLTLYLMIGLAEADASAAAKKTFIVVGGSDCVLLLGVALLWHLTKTTRMDVIHVAVVGKASWVAFLCFAVAAFAKAGAMPFHSWLPDCGEKAPVSVTAFLPAALDKLLGIYLLTRVCMDLFLMNSWTRAFLLAVGAGTVILAVMMALIQHDLKRLLSYHAVSQVGYMVLGIGTGTAVGIAGGLFHMLNNAIYKSCLFLSAGAVEHRVGTTDMDRLGGLGRAMPLTLGATLIASLAISGVPPMNGFASKWMVYQGLVEMGKGGGRLWVLWLAAAMVGSALTLASFVKLLHAVFLRKASPTVERSGAREVGAAMWVPMVFLAAVCVVFGVFARRFPLARLILPAVPAVTFGGRWVAGTATVVLLISLTLGLVIYWLTTARKPRTCDTYIGGEILPDVYVSGAKKGDDLEVSGVDFYQTVRDLWPLRGIYAWAEKKRFDLYEVGSFWTFRVSEGLQKFHSGVLTNYLLWYVLGLIALLFLLR